MDALPIINKEDILFEDDNITIFCTKLSVNQPLVEFIATKRAIAFSDVLKDVGEFDIDEYDETSLQLGAVAKKENTIIGGMRLGLGNEILKKHGPAGLYMTRYWNLLDPMVGMANKGIEWGRVWVAPQFQRKTLGLSVLWKGLALFLHSRSEYEYLFGTVSLAGYPDYAVNMITSYLLKYHATDMQLVIAKYPLNPSSDFSDQLLNSPQEVAFRYLVNALNQINTKYPVPTLVRKYVSFKAKVANDIGWDERKEKVVALFYVPIADVQEVIARFRER